METVLLLTVAVTPPACLMYFIYWMDRHEPESMKNIVTAMLVGALSAIPAVIVCMVLDFLPIFHLEGLTGSFFESFLQVAPSEEFFKFYFIYLFLKNKPFYNRLNDSIVYYGAGALGFALFENIFYVLDYGFVTGVMRAFTSIPIHTFCGVVVGYHAGLARFSNHKKPKLIILRGLFIAYLTHATFNTIVSADNLALLLILLIPLLITVYLFGYKTLRRGQKMSASLSKIQTTLPREQESVQVAITPGHAQPVSMAQESKHLTYTFNGPDNVVISRRDRWKLFISRTLFVLCAIAWLTIFIDIEDTFAKQMEFFLGMLFITAIPLTVAALLEISFHQKTNTILKDPVLLSVEGNQQDHYRSPAINSYTSYPQDEVKINEFGQRYLPPKKEIWKAIISRTIFVLIALTIILAFYGYDPASGELAEFIFGVFVLSIIPFMIAITIELSYQRRKRTYFLID